MQQRNSAKKKIVRFWALAEKLSRWVQLRNTALHKLFLSQNKSPKLQSGEGYYLILYLPSLFIILVRNSATAQPYLY